MPPRRPAQRGMTLIELLAVLVIASLAATAGVPALVRRASAHPIDRTEHTLRHHWMRWRAGCLGAGGAVAPEGSGLRFQQADTASTWAWTPADGSWCEFTVTAWPLVSDARARSADALVLVRDTQHWRRWRIAGLTGAWVLDEEGP